MFTDITGKKRLKIGLHTHTTRSDGSKLPEEAIQLYASAGYDAIALTDHWKYGESYKALGLAVISGCEYDVTGFQPGSNVKETFHIVGIGMTRDPEIPRELTKDDSKFIHERVKLIVRMIREVDGIAVLAHPAWSLNTPEQILSAGDFDAVEIYNSVSEWGMSDRPYSGLIVDMLATCGMTLPLLATDDTHYYNGDECRGMVMLEADAAEELGMVGAIRSGRFYATQGPEIHLERIAPDKVKLSCSPVEKIVFFSNLQWASGRVLRGKHLTEAIYILKTNQQESFVRAEVTDENGLVGWSNIIVV
ncbi:MAG: PHP domain-containing protein [Roseburia sp.]|nr:PHP domain-containing protein [Roseburia sp.]